MILFTVSSSSFQYGSLALFAILGEHGLIRGQKERSLDPSRDPSVSEGLAPPLPLHQEPSPATHCFGLCIRTAEFQPTSAPAAEASVTFAQDSFLDVPPGRSPFPADCGGFMHTNALLCRPVTAHYVRKEETVRPVNLCPRHAGCCVVSNVACQHHRVTAVSGSQHHKSVYISGSLPIAGGCRPDYTPGRLG